MISNYMNKISDIEAFNIGACRDWAESRNLGDIVQYIDRLLAREDFATNRFTHKNSILLLISCFAGDETSSTAISAHVQNNTFA